MKFVVTELPSPRNMELLTNFWRSMSSVWNWLKKRYKSDHFSLYSGSIFSTLKDQGFDSRLY
jgi:hypothetical protein